MNVWEYSYLAPESLRERQELSDRLERLAIGFYCLRTNEDRLGVDHYAPPKLYPFDSEVDV